MKILQVNKFFYIKGGSETYLFSIIDYLKKSGHTIAEFSMNDSQNWPSEWSEFFVEHIDYEIQQPLKKMDHAFKIIYSVEAKKKIGKLLDIFKPDLVHLHIFQHQLSTSILSEIKKRKIPVVYTAHDLKSICPNYKMLTHGTVCERCKEHRYYNCVWYKCTKDSYFKSLVNVIEMYCQFFWKHYDLIDLIITPSNFYKEKLVEFRFSKRKVIHIPNCVDVKRCVPKYQHEGYCLFLGRLSKEKGIETLIEAMKRVNYGKLVIAGIGPLEREISKKIDSGKIRGIEMVGFKTGEDLEALIQSAICTLLPSEWYENGPMSLLESFSYGKPVIGSNIGGIPEHIEEGVDGFMFECGNADELADRINKMFADPERAIEMGKNARKKVENLYSLETHMERLLKVYDQLIPC